MTEFRIAEYVPGRGRRVSVEDSHLGDKSEDSQSEEEEEEDYLSRYLDLHRKAHIVSSNSPKWSLQIINIYVLKPFKIEKKKSFFIFHHFFVMCKIKTRTNNVLTIHPPIHPLDSDSEAEEVNSKMTEGHVSQKRASKGENSPIAQGTLAGFCLDSLVC